MPSDGQSNVQVLYTKSRGGLLSPDYNQNGLPPPVIAEAYHGKISARELVPALADASVSSPAPREARQLRAFVGQQQHGARSPVSLAVDAESGSALVGTQWRVAGDAWTGPLKGSMQGYGRVAPAGRDQFHALVLGNGLTDWRLDTKDIPLLYMLLSGQEWSATLELGAVSARDVLGFMPQQVDIASAANGRAFVVWPTRAAVVGRWIEVLR